VAADKQADSHLFQHLVLADDDSLDLPYDFCVDFAKASNSGL
jgi:hypothetical protein